MGNSFAVVAKPSLFASSSISILSSPDHFGELFGINLMSSRVASRCLEDASISSEFPALKSKVFPSLLSEHIPLLSPFEEMEPAEMFKLDSESPKRSSNLEDPLNQSVKDRFDELKERLLKLDEAYKSWKITFKKCETVEGKISFSLNYFKINEDNFLSLLSQYFPQTHFKQASELLKDTNTTIKWSDSIVPLIINVSKLCIILHVEKELSELEASYQKLRLEMDSKTIKFDDSTKKSIIELAFRLSKDKKSAVNKSQQKTEKIFSTILSFPLEKIFDISSKQASKVCKSSFGIVKAFRTLSRAWKTKVLQNEWISHLQTRFVVDSTISMKSIAELNQEAEQFLNSLKDCHDISEVKSKCSQLGLDVELPLSIEQWRDQLENSRFKKQLTQSYFYWKGKRPFLNLDLFNLYNSNKFSDYESQHKSRCMLFVIDQINECRSKNDHFDSIKKHFADLHITFQPIKIDPLKKELLASPTNHNEWEEWVQNPKVIENLAEQWFGHHEAIAQLALQGLRQFLLSKNSVESRFIFYRAFESVANLAFSVLQLVILLPAAKLYSAVSILELVVSDLLKLPIPGIGIIPLFFPLYRDFNFRIDNFLVLSLKALFARTYKPHEYSSEGFQLGLKTSWYEFLIFYHYLLSSLRKAILWMKVKAVEQLILGCQPKPFEEDKRVLEINENFERKHKEFDLKIGQFKTQLTDLMVKDVKLNLQSQDQVATNGSAAVDPIHDLVHGLTEANFDFFPPHVLDFFETHVGIKLKESSKESIKTQLEDFLSCSEENLIDAYRSNRYQFLRV